VASPIVPVERTFQLTDPLSQPELEAILEAAYLVVSSDRQIREEEEAALARVAERLAELNRALGGAGIAPPLENLLVELGERRNRDGQNGRVEAVAAALPRPTTRALAYRVACAISLSDLETHDREFEVDLALISALGLPQETADEIASEVQESLAALAQSA
jgi:tellurite resistance protein